MNARLENKIYRSRRRIRRNAELDRADTVAIVLFLLALVGMVLAGWIHGGG